MTLSTKDIVDYEKEIEALSSLADAEDLEKVKEALKIAVDLLRVIEDERKSLWLMLDEIKASDTENYADLLMQETKKKIELVRASVTKKVGFA